MSFSYMCFCLWLCTESCFFCVCVSLCVCMLIIILHIVLLLLMFAPSKIKVIMLFVDSCFFIGSLLFQTLPQIIATFRPHLTLGVAHTSSSCACGRCQLIPLHVCHVSFFSPSQICAGEVGRSHIEGVPVQL